MVVGETSGKLFSHRCEPVILAGTIVGALIGSLILTTASAIYSHSLRRTNAHDQPVNVGRVDAQQTRPEPVGGQRTRGDEPAHVVPWSWTVHGRSHG